MSHAHSKYSALCFTLIISLNLTLCGPKNKVLPSSSKSGIKEQTTQSKTTTNSKIPEKRRSHVPLSPKFEPEVGTEEEVQLEEKEVKKENQEELNVPEEVIQTNKIQTAEKQSAPIIPIYPAPTFKSSPPSEIKVEEQYSYQIESIETDDYKIIYSLKNSPSDMSINEQGLITWNPTSNYAGQEVPVTVLAEQENNESNFEEQSFTINVIAPPPPPPPPPPPAPTPYGGLCTDGSTIIGKLYDIPEVRDDNYWPTFNMNNEKGEICTSTIDVAPRSWDSGFPGVDGLKEWFGIVYETQIDISIGGDYEFTLLSDDGSMLYVDGNLVIDFRGLHPPAEKSGSINLSPGKHSIKIEYFQGPATQVALQFFWTPPNGSKALVPASVFRRP